MPEVCLAGHAILNHDGQLIRVTRRTLRALDVRHYLRRDRSSGLLRLPREFHPILLALEAGDRVAPYMRELGSDCSGPQVVVCHCLECRKREESLSEHRALSAEWRRQSVEKAISESRKARRRHA